MHALPRYIIREWQTVQTVPQMQYKHSVFNFYVGMIFTVHFPLVMCSRMWSWDGWVACAFTSPIVLWVELYTVLVDYFIQINAPFLNLPLAWKLDLHLIPLEPSLLPCSFPTPS